MQLKPINEQVIVVTGASSGIGLATAQLAAEQGARLVVVARNGAVLNDVAADLRAKGATVEVCVADIADPDSAERIAAAALAAFGRVDTWVNIAAAGVYGRFDQIPEADHRRVFEVGYFGTVRGSLKAVEVMRASGGALINIGSVLGDVAILQQGVYASMKHAVHGFTNALRAEVMEAGDSVQVTLIKPGAIHTPWPEHARNYMDKPASLPPLIYDPRLVAKAVVFAAAHLRREMTVGGSGALVGVIGTHFPALTELGEALIGTRAQQTDQPPPPEVEDNLYASRSNGRVESEQDTYVRRTSLWLDVQMYPVRAAGAIGAGVLAAALLGLRRR